MQYGKLLLWMLWIQIFFIFRGDKLRTPFYFHFKINFVTDFAETKEGLIQRPTIKWKRNTVNNFTRASKFCSNHNGTNTTQKAIRNKWQKWKNLLKHIFYCSRCWVSIELMLQKVSGNLNFVKDSWKKSLFRSPS